MTKQAPTKKVANGIDNGFYAYIHNVMVVARAVDAEMTFDIDPRTGDEIVNVTEAHYTITSHHGEMPAFHTSTYNTLQELANAMRECADLRAWKLIEHES